MPKDEVVFDDVLIGLATNPHRNSGLAKELVEAAQSLMQSDVLPVTQVIRVLHLLEKMERVGNTPRWQRACRLYESVVVFGVSEQQAAIACQAVHGWSEAERVDALALYPVIVRL